MKKIILLLTVLVFAGVSMAVVAQETPQVDPAATAATPAVPAEPVPLPIIKTPFTQSFLFTPAEVAAIRRAQGGVVSGTAALGADQTTNVPQRRLIVLSGVVFRGENDWILWLNGRKVTPKDMLPEIVDVVVAKDKVHLKWFDVGLNDVISITMRPHQTYDIVTGVLLPG